MKLALRLLRNTIANYVGQLITLVAGLFLTPFMIHMLGETQYGIWTLASSLVAYFVFFDLGFANALAKYTAEYSARGDQNMVNRLSSTLFVIFIGVGCLALVVAVCLSFGFTRFFTVAPEFCRSAQWAALLLGASFAISLPLSIFNALIVGYQRYDVLNAISSLGVISQAGLTVFVLVMGWGVIGLSVVTLFVTILKPLLLWAALSRWVERSFTLKVSLFDKTLTRLLVSYSIFMFIIFACRQVETSSSSIIVGYFVGVEEVTRYSIGLKMSGLLRNLVMPMTLIFFPAFSELGASSDPSRLGRLLIQGVKVTVAVGGLLTGFLVVLSRPLISMWIGPEFADSAAVAIILTVQVFLVQQMAVVGGMLQGLGRLKLWAVLHILIVVLSTLFSVAFVGRWGPLAVALGSLLAWGIAYLIALPYGARIVGVSCRVLVKGAVLVPMSAVLVSSLVLYGLASVYVPDNLIKAGAEAMISGIIYLLICWFWCLSDLDRTVFLNAISGIFHRIGTFVAQLRES